MLGRSWTGSRLFAAAVVSATDAHIRSLAGDILKRDEYAAWRPEPQSAWLDVLRALGRWLDGLSDWMNDLSWNQPVLYWLIVGGLLIVSGLLVAHIVWSIRVALSMPAPAVPERLGPEPPRFAEEAEALARSGRFLDAAHRLQLASIDVLLRRRVVELSRSDPNRTLRHRLMVADLPDEDRRTLLRLLDRLEHHWFRDRAQDHTLYEAWRDLYARLEGLPQAA